MQDDVSGIVVTGNPILAPIVVAYEQSRMLLSSPKVSLRALSRLSAGYKLSARYDTKSFWIRERMGICESPRGLNAFFARD